MELLEQLVNNNYFNDEDEAKTAFFTAFSHVVGSRNQAEQVKLFLDFLASQAEGFQKAGINGFVAGQAKTAELKERLKSTEEYAEMNVQEALQEIRSTLGI